MAWVNQFSYWLYVQLGRLQAVQLVTMLVDYGDHILQELLEGLGLEVQGHQVGGKVPLCFECLFRGAFAHGVLRVLRTIHKFI